MNEMTDSLFPTITEGLIGDALVSTVDARELHKALGVGRDFSNWIKDRIDKYDFLENQDFVVFAGFGENPQGGRRSKEYAVSIDMAKEIAMVENNDAGRRCRRHFIECERRLKVIADAMTPAETLLEQVRLMVAVERRQKAIEAKQAKQDEAIAENTTRLNQIETACDHFTCIGYARWVRGTSIDYRLAADLGQRATRRARQLGVTPSKVPDPRFGKVSTYPKSILDLVWDERFALVH